MPSFRLRPEILGDLSPEQEAQVVETLNSLRRGFQLNPLWNYAGHEKQREFHASRAPVIGFVGGNRSGKSHGSVIDDLIDCVDADCLPPWLLPYKRWEPPTYGRIITPDFQRSSEGVILEKLRLLTPAAQLLGGSWKDAYDQRRRRLSFENGSWIDFLSCEQDLSSHGGQALHFVHFDEEPPGYKGEQVYNENLARLIDFDGQAKFSMTPLLGLSWTYDELTIGGEPRNDDEVFCVQVDMDDNPHIDVKAKERVLKKYKSREEREARKSGRWVHLAGLIYEEFDEDAHVIPPCVPPEDATIIVGIDPGLRYMAAVVFMYHDTDDNLVVFEEIPLEQRPTVEVVAAAIRAVEEDYEIRPRGYIIDPAARNEQHQTGRSDQDEYARHGIYTTLGQNKRRPGFNAVKERLATVDPVTEEPRDPTFFVTANCPVTIKQFKRYRWRTESRGENAGKEEPVKRDDHLLDAIRYVVMSRPRTPTQRVIEKVRTGAERAFEHSVKTRLRGGRRSQLGGVFHGR